MRKLLRQFCGEVKTNRLAATSLMLVVVQMVIFVLPIFLNGGSTIHFGVSKDDALDLFTPIVLLPFIWFLFVAVAKDRPSVMQTLFFLAASAIWMEGHSIHLVADSIGNLSGEDRSTPGGSLVYFYDEVLGHYLIQGGIIAQSVLILWRGWFSKNPTLMGSAVPFLVSGSWYGWIFFVFSVEGLTVPLAMPAASLILGAELWHWRKTRRLGPVDIIFITGAVSALLMFSIWGLWHGGFPKLTKLD